MKYLFFIIGLLFSNIAHSQSNSSFNEPNQNKNSLLDFGAVGDGKTNDSSAFLKAISIVSKQSSKKILIPNNYNFNLGNVQIDFKKYDSGITFEFQGGILSNANLIGNNTRIKADRSKIFENINLSGSFISTSDSAYPEWFGCFPNDKKIDLIDALRNLDCVFYDISLGTGNYYTQKGEYMVRGLSGVSMANSRVILETDKSYTYLFSIGKIGGTLKDRNYDYNYIKNVSLHISRKSAGVQLKGNRGVIIGAAHKPFIENIRIKQSEDFQRFKKSDLENFLSNNSKVNDANVGIEFKGDSEVTHLSNVFTLADIGILFSEYTDIVQVSDYMNWCGQYGLANIYIKKNAVKSQNLLFTGTQSWNQGLYGFYSEDSNEWNTHRNNKFENVRIEQLTKEILQNGKVVSTSIRIGKSNLVAHLIFENIILSGASNGISIGETTSGNIYFDKINLVPDITIKRDFAIKTKLLPPSDSYLETPLQISLKNVDLFTDSESYFENSKNPSANRIGTERKNKFTDVVISYE